MISFAQLRETLVDLRESLEPHFARDTAYDPEAWDRDEIPSSGHCAAVAAIVQALLGGHLVSARIGNGSHWFNRLVLLDDTRMLIADADLTADQFGRPVPLVGPPGFLWSDTRLRDFSELNESTLERAATLAARAGVRRDFDVYLASRRANASRR